MKTSTHEQFLEAQMKLTSLYLDGQITVMEMEWFLGLAPGIRRMFMTGSERPAMNLLSSCNQSSTLKTEKFTLAKDLGLVTTPDDYDYDVWSQKFFPDPKGIILVNSGGAKLQTHFVRPSRILKPGDKLRVYICQQSSGGETSSEERIDFCRRQTGNQFIGIQAYPVILWLKNDVEFPLGRRVTSLDEKEFLPKDHKGRQLIPAVSLTNDYEGRECVQTLKVRVEMFYRTWKSRTSFFCFCAEQ